MGGARHGARRGLAGGWLLLPDALSVAAAYLIAFAARFHGAPGHGANLHAIVVTLPLVAAFTLLLAQVYGLYERHPLTWPEQVQSLFILVVLDAVLAMAASFFTRTFAVPRSVIALAAVIDFLLLYAYRRAVYGHWLRAVGPPRLLIVHAAGIVPDMGAGAAAPLPVASAGGGMRVIGNLAVTPRVPAAPLVLAAVAEHGAHGLLLDQSLWADVKEELALLAVERRLELFIVPRLLDVLILRSRPSLFGDRLVLSLTEYAGNGYHRALKRFIDISLGVLFLAIAAPVLAVVCAVVWVDDGRPVFYSQERVGLGGRRFTVWKVRTMRRDAEAATGPVLAKADDPRVTRSGRWLRQLHFDELPQLWNVLRGDMSLVGPRPERPSIHDEVAASLPQFSSRLRVLPGLTGLAQVSGEYETHPHEKLKFDVLYSLRASAAVDAEIMLRTVRNVLTGLARAMRRRR